MKWENAVIISFAGDEDDARQHESLARRYHIPAEHCFRMPNSPFPQSFTPIDTSSLSCVGPRTKLIIGGHGEPSHFNFMSPRELADGLHRCGLRSCGLITMKACAVGAGNYLKELGSELDAHGITVGWLKGYRGLVSFSEGRSRVGLPADLFGIENSKRSWKLGIDIGSVATVFGALAGFGAAAGGIVRAAPFISAAVAKLGLSSGAATGVKTVGIMVSVAGTGAGVGEISRRVAVQGKLPDRLRTKIVPGNAPAPNLSPGSRYKNPGRGIDEESQIESGIQRPAPALLRRQRYQDESRERQTGDIELQRIRGAGSGPRP
jgi:hypothetical protein